MKKFTKIPIGTNASRVEFHEKGASSTSIEHDTVIFGTPSHDVLVDAKQLYGWLKDYYEGHCQLAQETDDGRQYTCASSLY